ncbi:dTDP-4-dehydrorhamnose 3,5-epimerase [Ferrovibrio sp.]|uniref:dTDP-4-dehydrorhamnose 3,5-epimerase n=1 Tax=Ferrovibrio sp. TaxID=1917215 RepID=UPI001B6748E6|nr:dTDP-4-dehydrorhamnose 3,5-epimerase [Ferrovibrio sp.]MBP7066522.1 dTDP-4-dehydrorhamnose 3,5-epimerase [Ferrovibrio sp.]
MSLILKPLALAGPMLLTIKRFGDNRGWFTESYKKAALAEAGLEVDFVQDNHSFSAQAGTVRGMHYQIGATAQAKLIRCLRGRLVSVAVDIRRSSPSFGRHVMQELAGDSADQLFVPAGFAHGFCTLEPDTEIFYKVDTYYAPQDERGILWSDPALSIAWPVAPDQAVLSAKDAVHPLLRDQPDLFD